jgi:DNA primase
VALLGNEIAEQQVRIINGLGATPIIIPDQDRAGLNLFDRAAELGWAVASPSWEDDVKDSAEAVQRYGKLFVIVDAIMTASQGSIKINMAKKKLEHKLERLSENDD